MKYCSHCGNELRDEAVVCPKCGCSTKDTLVQQPSKTNGFAITGFVCSFFIPLLGLIFSVLGYAKSKEMNDNGKAMSIAGIAISIASTVVGAIIIATWC